MKIPKITNRCPPADTLNAYGLFIIHAKIPLHITASIENTINPNWGGKLRSGEFFIVIILFHASLAPKIVLPHPIGVNLLLIYLSFTLRLLGSYASPL